MPQCGLAADFLHPKSHLQGRQSQQERHCAYKNIWVCSSVLKSFMTYMHLTFYASNNDMVPMIYAMFQFY